MTVKLHIVQWTMAAPDRVNLVEFEAGTVCSVPEFLSEILLEAGYAEPYEVYKERKRKEALAKQQIDECAAIARERREASTRALDQRIELMNFQSSEIKRRLAEDQARQYTRRHSPEYAYEYGHDSIHVELGERVKGPQDI